MEEPPKSIFKEGSDHHLIVALTHVAPVVEALILLCIEGSKGCPCLVHMLYRMVTDTFIEASASCIGLPIEIVLLSDDSAHVEDKFLFDCVRIFLDLESGRHELVLCQRHAKTLT